MAKRIKGIRKALLCAMAVLCLAQTVYAGENTTHTYTVSVAGRYDWIRTQDAYLPATIYMQGMGLSKPEDLFFKDGLIYIADTGNSRIVVYDPEIDTYTSFGEGILRSPTGLFVTNDGKKYIADYGNETVYIFSRDNEVIQEITRPESHIFTDRNVFRPRNVAVSSGNSIYVVGEASAEGLMQFSIDGEFLGFYGSNLRALSATEKFQELIYNQVMKDKAPSYLPKAIYNVDISSRDLIYTVTQTPRTVASISQVALNPIEEDMRKTKEDNAIRVLNVAGRNIMSPDERILDESNYVDVAVSATGGVYALASTGIITEYDIEGEVVFPFGGIALSSERAGLFTTPVAIDVDENGYVYVLDKQRELIQVYYPTAFALETHKAITAYEQGNYVESIDLWLGLLSLNGMSKLAHNGYGRALFSLNQYEGAMEEFRFTNNKEEYSQAFWEVRNSWLNKNIGFVFGVLIGLYVVYKILKSVNKRTGVITKWKDAVKTGINRSKLLRDVLYMTTVMRHPIDSMYYLKIGAKGSVASATVINVLAFVVFFLHMNHSAFIFRPFFNPIRVNMLMITFFVPVVLLMVCNYMISTISDGEGSVKNVYVCISYALSPYVVLTPFLLVVSYGLTKNESFIFYFLTVLIILWAVLNIFLFITEVHNLGYMEAFKNVLLTLGAIVIALAAFILLYLLGKEAIGFVIRIVMEVLYRG